MILKNGIENPDAKGLPEEIWIPSTFQDHFNEKKKCILHQIKSKGLILMAVCCSILILMDFWSKKDLPLIKEGEVREHLNKLGIHESVRPDGLQP